jgi:hypothetical protein
LLIVPGSSPLPANHPIAAMLPFDLSKPVRVSLAGETLLAAGLPAQKKAKLPFNRWLTRQAVQSAGWSVSGSGDLFLAIGSSGFGRVGVLSGNPAEVAADVPLAAQFWVEQVGGLLNDGPSHLTYDAASSETELSSQNYGRKMYEVGEIGRPTNELLQGLMAIRELQPLSVGWVLLLFAVLAVLIGPLDYLVLKKLDRLPWTWITCSVMLALFTVGAYYGVQALRAGPMQVRSVTVIDGIQPAAPAAGGAAPARGAGWATDYVGIFASGSGEFELTGVAPSQWWSSIAPTRGDEYYYSGRSYDNVLSRQISCVQADGGNLPDPLPISIWSMQCLLSEHAVSAMPLSATVTKESSGDLTIRLTNHADVPIQSGCVSVPGNLNNLALVFSTVPPKGTIQLPGFVGDHSSLSVQSQACFEAVGIVQRTRAIKAMAAQGAVVIIAKYDQPAGPVSIKGESCVLDHTQWVRLVVPVQPAGTTH